MAQPDQQQMQQQPQAQQPQEQHMAQSPVNSLMQNKPLLIGAGIGILIIIALIVVMIVTTGSKGGEPEAKKSPLIEEETELLIVDHKGQMFEIQALLAKNGITVRKAPRGNKTALVLSPKDKITEDQRDRAIITIVQSGIMDKNIGLEIFDKGDFTSSREDKRIRLARAINGELARLIRKMPNIDDASVFVAIPKSTIFTSMKSPTTATVQLVLPRGADKLDRSIIRAITNLLLGSIDGLEAENISITDTNGNVYSSIMSAGDDMMKLLEDKDAYMKKKIIAQLDKLIGRGNYVVTVSTYLRETPLESDKVIFNPEESSVGNKQKFIENLGDKSEDKNKLSNAVSAYLPGGMPNPESKANRNYQRTAEEYSYKVGQTRISELKKPGILEEISIAVTINKGSIPSGMGLEELKELIARTASPKAFPENVSIAFSNEIKPLLSTERPVQLPQAEKSGNPWWTIAAILLAIIFIGFMFISGRVKDAAKKQNREIDSLLEIAHKQEKAIAEANNRTLQLQNLQQQMIQNFSAQPAQQQPQQIPQQQKPQQQAIPNLQGTIQDIKEGVGSDVDEQEFATTLKSWIESAG